MISSRVESSHNGGIRGGLALTARPLPTKKASTGRIFLSQFNVVG